MKSFYVELAEVLEVDEVKPDDVLLDFETWDSLTELSVLATVDASYGVNLTAADLRNLKTVGELVAKVESLSRK